MKHLYLRRVISDTQRSLRDAAQPIYVKWETYNWKNQCGRNMNLEHLSVVCENYTKNRQHQELI